MTAKCKITACRSMKTKPCSRCGKPVCIHHAWCYSAWPICSPCSLSEPRLKKSKI